MQESSTDKTVRNDLKEFNFQSLTTQIKKGELLVSMMPAFEKAFNLMGDDVVQESKAKLLIEVDYDKRASSIMSKMKKQMNKN